jgi:hypothetical protein
MFHQVPEGYQAEEGQALGEALLVGSHLGAGSTADVYRLKYAASGEDAPLVRDACRCGCRRGWGGMVAAAEGGHSTAVSPSANTGPGLSVSALHVAFCRHV